LDCNQQVPVKEVPEEERVKMASVREEVQEFAESMELELMKHDDRPGWKDCDPFWLLGRLNEEVRELEIVLKDPTRDGRVTQIREEAADVGNFAMMIADVIKQQWIKKVAERLPKDFSLKDVF